MTFSSSKFIKLSEQYKITLDNEFKLNHLDKDLNIKTEFGYITDNRRGGRTYGYWIEKNSAL